MADTDEGRAEEISYPDDPAEPFLTNEESFRRWQEEK